MHNYYNVPALETAKSVGDFKLTLTERLKNERADLAHRLAELDAAITALDANPTVQQVLDLVQKVSRY